MSDKDLFSRDHDNGSSQTFHWSRVEETTIRTSVNTQTPDILTMTIRYNTRCHDIIHRFPQCPIQVTGHPHSVPVRLHTRVCFWFPSTPKTIRVYIFSLFWYSFPPVLLAGTRCSRSKIKKFTTSSFFTTITDDDIPN